MKEWMIALGSMVMVLAIGFVCTGVGVVFGILASAAGDYLVRVLTGLLV